MEHKPGETEGLEPVSTGDSIITLPDAGTPIRIASIFEKAGEAENRSFGTFSGVFRPTILTILGVMMYIREGWLVGNAGLAGAILVLLCCYVITGATALSISSITTNIRVGSGGVFSIISQSLGLEVGGSVGIPLYLVQGLSAAFYMKGIVATWTYIFPDHPKAAVLFSVFAISLIVAYFGAKMVFKIQLVVMALTMLALGSMFMGLGVHPIQATVPFWGNFEDGNLQILFAVFFPAATGIMVGASMSGNLKKPRVSIPIGTLSAWGVSLLVYLSLAVWFAHVGSPEELRTHQYLAVEKARWGPIVLVGIIASCFCATLSSLVAAPRVLQALSVHRLVPLWTTFEKQHKGEPRNATLVTSLVVLLALLLGDINSLAQLLTMFFLVIFFMINLVLFIEHRLRMISFRPQFPIPSWVPVVGSLTSIIAILIINPLTGLLAIGLIMGIYFYLDHLQLKTPWETVHSGIFAGIANWAARKVILDQRISVKRSWKPDLLVPVDYGIQLGGDYRMIRALIHPRGSIQVVGFHTEKRSDELADLIADFRSDELFATYSKIEDTNFLSGMRTCLSVKEGEFFKPNTLFTSIEKRSEEELQGLIYMARANRMGVVFLAHHPEAGLGRECAVNLWVRDQSPDWLLGLQLANLDYAVLMSYQLKENWKARIRVFSVVEDVSHREMAHDFLVHLLEYARISGNVEIQVAHGSFMDFLEKVPRADINIFGLSEKVDKPFLEEMVRKTRGSCLFVLDSGNESALA